MKLLIKKILDENKIDITPTLIQANELDAGYDVVATSDPQIVGEFIERPLDRLKVWKNVRYIEYETNLYVAPDQEYESKIVNFNTDASGALCGVVRETVSTDYHIEGFPRSSVSKQNLILTNCIPTIDTGYRGQILFRFKYIFQPDDYIVVSEAGGTRIYGIVNNDFIYKKGDKIVQLKPRPNIKIEQVVVDELPPSQRNVGGFGSSGK